MATTYENINDGLYVKERYRLSLFINQILPFNHDLDTLFYCWMMDGIVDFQDICTQDLTWTELKKQTKTLNFVMTSRKYQYAWQNIWLDTGWKKEVSDILQMRNKIQTDFKTYSESQSLSN